MITTCYRDCYIRKDGTEYLKDNVKYHCYHKTNKLCECDGQTNYQATAKKASFNIEKNKRQLEVLQLEIGKTLLGDSIYTPADLQEAIKVVRKRITEDEEKLAEMEEAFLYQEETLKSIMRAYRKFKSWAEEFDSASLDQKKMIACQLFDRIELGKDYEQCFLIMLNCILMKCLETCCIRQLLY